MQLIQCPWCGPREEVEFHYGGQAHVAYPDDPYTLASVQKALAGIIERLTAGEANRPTS